MKKINKIFILALVITAIPLISLATSCDGCDPDEDCTENPRVETTHAAHITANSASIWGKVTSAPVLHTWLRYDENMSDLSCHQGDGYGYAGIKFQGDSFGITAKNLKPDTTYYYIACGRNKLYGASGRILSFTTAKGQAPQEKPEMFTNTANAIGETSATLRGQVQDGDDVDVWFRYSTSSSVSCSNGTNATVGNKDSGDWFGKTVYGLSPNTTYYYRACGQNSAGSDTGNLESFKTDGTVIQDPADVYTNTANNVGETSATLRGQVVDGDNVTAWFRYSTSSSVSCSNGTNVSVSGSYDDGDSFSRTITSLNDNTTYYYRACGSNAYGSDTGELRSFKTDGTVIQDPADVYTNSASSVDEDSARLNGEVVDGDNVDTWFVMDDDGNLSCSSGYDYKYNTGNKDKGDGFYYSVYGLNDNTTYYYRACGSNAYGSDEGNLKQFTTDDGGNNDDLDITTNSASSVNEDSARLNGEVDGADNVDVWFVYSYIDSSPECNGNDSVATVSGDKDDGESFYANIDDLEEDTKYYFRACGETGSDEDEGSVRYFTTDDGGNNDDLEINTNSATKIEEDSARLNGDVSGEDNVDVWFVYSDGDSSPECDDNDEYAHVSGDKDDGDDFYADIDDLEEDTKYYFRACGEKGSDEAQGSVKSFTTDEEDDDDDLRIDTNAATNVDEDSARLNGDVNGLDNVDVWFVYSDTDSTPECDDNDDYANVSGSFDDGEDFYKNIYGLDEDTTYYYRACGEKGSDENDGSVKSFTTDGDSQPVNRSVVTNTPIGVGQTSATLRSIHVNRNGNVLSSFEYGRTTGLGLDSATRTLNTTTNSQTIFGLSPNTRYYYRAVMIDEGETYRGLLQSFVTQGTPIPPNPGPNPEPPIIIVVEEGLNIDKQVSQEKTSGYGLEIDAEPGDVVYYKVRVRNNTDETMTDIDVSDHIPYYLELDNEQQTDDDSDKYVSWIIDRLRANETRIFITEMRVKEETPDGETIFSHATIETEDQSENTNDVVIVVNPEEELVTDDEEGNRQAASIFGAGSSFFPQSLLGWLGLLVAILIIAYLIYKVLGERNETKLRKAALTGMNNDFNG